MSDALLVQEMAQAWMSGDHARAEALALRVCDAAPNEPNARQILAAQCLERGEIDEAVAHARIADAAAPNQPSILNILAGALREQGDSAGARAAFTRAGAAGFAEAYAGLGNLERSEGACDAAIAAYEMALALNPKLGAAHAGLARVHEQRHSLALAKQHAEQALILNPADDLARLTLAQVLVRERAFAQARETVLPAAAAKGPNTRALALGLIGETLDREGNAPEAFAAFTAANQILRKLHQAALNDTASPFHPDSVARLTRFIEHENVSAWSKPARFEQRAPVFLIGFPRSGTTLLDQILASHSRVTCLEEKDLLAPVVADQLTPEALARWRTMPDALVHERRTAYWQSVEAAAGGPVGNRVLVDKLPLNLVLLPAIMRFFPDAKILIAVRDPRDVAFSCYQQRFGMNAAMVRMLTLEDIAAYYDGAMALLMRSERKLSTPAFPVRYEEVVSDLEPVTRALAAYLDLPFEPAMLDFSTTARRRDVGTPSARQVVEPLYARSVGRWRTYTRELAPVLPALTAWATRLGYEE